MPTFGSLFAGIGGLDLGLERAGWECRWQVEVDPWCRRVLAKHWPNVPKYGDVREVGENLEQVDLIAGGFPCQPVSIAGKRRGIEDQRWLWPEFYRVLRAVRPRYALLENVAGILHGEMGIVLRDLAEGGFDAEWSVISACSMGAPHLRERVFIVAYPTGDRLEGLFGQGGWQANGASQALPTGNAEQMADANGYWREQLSESFVRGVVDGVPDTMERLRGLGNAVVPQVAEYIGKELMRVLEGGKQKADP